MAQIIFVGHAEGPIRNAVLWQVYHQLAPQSRKPSFFLVTRQATHTAQHPATDDLYSTKSPYNIQSLVIYSRQAGWHIVLCATTYYAP